MQKAFLALGAGFYRAKLSAKDDPEAHGSSGGTAYSGKVVEKERNPRVELSNQGCDHT